MAAPAPAVVGALIALTIRSDGTSLLTMVTTALPDPST